jgi:hypothetical protein
MVVVAPAGNRPVVQKCSGVLVSSREPNSVRAGAFFAAESRGAENGDAEGSCQDQKTNGRSHVDALLIWK